MLHLVVWWHPLRLMNSAALPQTLDVKRHRRSPRLLAKPTSRWKRIALLPLFTTSVAVAFQSDFCLSQRRQRSFSRSLRRDQSRDDVDDELDSRRGRTPSTNPSLFVLESSMYDEKRPRRISSSATLTSTESRESKLSWKDEWGVRYHHPTLFQSKRAENQPPFYEFPQTIASVTDACAHAICAVLSHNPKSTPRLPSLLPRHYVNSGRLGVELDFGGGSHDASLARSRDEAATLRYAALVLAAKLSQQSTWRPFEANKKKDHKPRPVTVYFNTVQQALAASQQLLQLKRIEHYRALLHSPSQSASTALSKVSTIYDTILIRCLCQGDSIPKEMLANREPAHSAKAGKRNDRQTPRSSTSLVDAAAGLLLIVQPTDYNTDYQPPGPVVTAVEALQRLSARASLERLGVVVVSPRFLNNPVTPCTYTTSASPFWSKTDDPQTEFQEIVFSSRLSSGSYDGREPAIGPTPWIMRDFTPPVFTWVASATSVNPIATVPLSAQSRLSSKDRVVRDEQLHHGMSHLVLWQSILHQDTAWNLFAVSTQSSSSSATPRPTGGSFRYLASTSSGAGRPTRDVIHELFIESIND